MGQQTQEIRLGLEQEIPYLNFINSLRSKATIKSYRLTINHYMQFQGVSNISSLLKQDNKAIEQQIISYLVDMRLNQKLSYSILALRLAAVRKFYEMNDVIINWKKVNNYLGENTKREWYRRDPIRTAKIESEKRKKKRQRALLLVGRGLIKCINCGCNRHEFLEVNHINRGGGKENEKSSKFYCDLLAGRRGIEDLELRCKVCNMLHYSEKIYGKLPYKIIWPGNSGKL
jgi:hypothetical protein